MALMQSELGRVVDPNGRDFPASDSDLGPNSQGSEPSGVTRNTGQILRLVKFEHSVFALPLVMAGAFLAAGGIPAISVLCGPRLLRLVRVTFLLRLTAWPIKISMRKTLGHKTGLLTGTFLKEVEFGYL